MVPAEFADWGTMVVPVEEEEVAVGSGGGGGESWVSESSRRYGKPGEGGEEEVGE